MPSNEILSRIEAGRSAVLSQTALLHAEFGRAQSQWKADGTRVTPVDLAISEAIQTAVTGAFPMDQFFSEELAHDGACVPVSSSFCWMLDPIDGTNNYAMGISHCAISLALLQDGVPVYGFVYDMSRRSLIEGGPGFGVTDGARPVRVRETGPTRHALIGFHSPIEARHRDAASRIVEHTKIRGLGSSTLHLAYVAAGILEGTVDHNVRLWDIAAAMPLVWAAGGETRFLENNPIPFRVFDLKMPRIVYVAGAPETCRQLEQWMRGV
jgi:myo-inositol-1(or 4)-monophosphatase